MKNTGYIRNIDGSGRISIPIELRKKFKVQEGEALVINHNDESIILTKYSHVADNKSFIKKSGDKFNLAFGYNVIITDLDDIIYSNKNFETTKVSEKTINDILNRDLSKLEELKLNKEITIKNNFKIAKIISYSRVTGIVIVYSDKDDDLEKHAKFLADVINSKIEIT